MPRWASFLVPTGLCRSHLWNAKTECHLEVYTEQSGVSFPSQLPFTNSNWVLRDAWLRWRLMSSKIWAHKGQSDSTAAMKSQRLGDTKIPYRMGSSRISHDTRNRLNQLIAFDAEPVERSDCNRCHWSWHRSCLLRQGLFLSKELWSKILTEIPVMLGSVSDGE